ncbi:hypothetical protein JMJ77_0005855 [Colletotrichum scovillei]|uniref:Uncharacterized protein n=1 Tax=Colletotrichum scovillei TaxID=1209932 RepID=A0A9P7UIN8_9PEZI|nr:hypothetical protein JMJ77_0005855 [Colletotrichum scovillei]KAG7077023.1 hypothetical protein JMJ76_0014278 [Colletotrichum scovillei]KAG7084108.1 hypothetical protein JMJ78_0009548 [Colletotrichum scovillei]
MSPDPSDSISKKKNHPIDAIVRIAASTWEYDESSDTTKCSRFVPRLCLWLWCRRHRRRRRPLLRTHAHYTPQPLGRSIDGLGMTARYESRASRLQAPGSRLFASFSAFVNAIESVSGLTHGFNTAVCAALISRTTYLEALVLACLTVPTPLSLPPSRELISKETDLQLGTLFRQASTPQRCTVIRQHHTNLQLNQGASSSVFLS